MVLPFRNAAATLSEAVASIEAQSFTAFECWLVDDGSSDSSATIAAAVCARDLRFRMLPAGGGLVPALNVGVAAARAPLIARMDADDLSHPQRLERQVALLESDPTLSIAGCLIEGFGDDPRRDGMRRYERWLNTLTAPEDIRAGLFVEAPLVHPSVVMRAAALRQIGGYCDSDGPEDYDLWMRFILGGYRAAKVPEVLLYWRDSPRRLTRVHPRYAAERLFATKVRYFDQVCPRGSALQVWGAGPIGRRWARALRQRQYRLTRFIDVDARKIGRIAQGAPICGPEAVRPGDGFILCAVGSPGARARIEAYLGDRGLRPWEDYLSVA